MLPYVETLHSNNKSETSRKFRNCSDVCGVCEHRYSGTYFPGSVTTSSSCAPSVWCFVAGAEHAARRTGGKRYETGGKFIHNEATWSQLLYFGWNVVLDVAVNIDVCFWHNVNMLLLWCLQTLQTNPAQKVGGVAWLFHMLGGYNRRLTKTTLSSSVYFDREHAQ